ncbi:hypothetical protein [Pasteuria penetrans]|uniref:hypothetical protein n=1 Tax=Pasteuria penetrans TaxID=86005 RepID=UPI000F9F412A|nr:hypothetical protein [Pasteuria penetrans]
MKNSTRYAAAPQSMDVQDKDLEAEMQEVRRRLEKAQNDAVRAEARLESLKQQEAELWEEVRALGISPEEMDKELQDLQKQIRDCLDTAQVCLCEASADSQVESS